MRTRTSCKKELAIWSHRSESDIFLFVIMSNIIYLFLWGVILFPPTGLWRLAGGEGETRKVKHSLRFLYPPLALYFLTNSFLWWIAALFALCLDWAVNSAFALFPGTCLNCCSILYPCWWFNSTQCSISSRKNPGANLWQHDTRNQNDCVKALSRVSRYPLTAAKLASMSREVDAIIWRAQRVSRMMDGFCSGV